MYKLRREEAGLFKVNKSSLKLIMEKVMMKSTRNILKYFTVLLLGIVLLSGCSKEKDIKVSDDKINELVSVVRQLSEGIHSNIENDSLKEIFERNKEYIGDRTYGEYFDMDDFSVQNRYDFYYEVASSEIEEVFVEKINELGITNIVLVIKLGIIEDNDEFVGMHRVEPFYTHVTDVYTIQEGKIADLNFYW